MLPLPKSVLPPKLIRTLTGGIKEQEDSLAVKSHPSVWFFSNISPIVTTGWVFTSRPFLGAGPRVSPNLRGQFGCQVAATISS